MASRVEQETVVVWNQDEDTAIVTTCARATVTKLTKLGHLEAKRRGNSEPYLHRFVIPRRSVSFRGPVKRVQRTLSRGQFLPREATLDAEISETTPETVAQHGPRKASARKPK